MENVPVEGSRRNYFTNLSSDILRVIFSQLEMEELRCILSSCKEFRREKEGVRSQIFSHNARKIVPDWVGLELYDAAGDMDSLPILQRLCSEWMGNRVINWMNRDYYNWTPMMYAVDEGNAKAVHMLIEAGCHVGKIYTGDTVKTVDSAETPIYLAALRGHFHIARLLIEAGADVNTLWDNYTPLNIAIENIGSPGLKGRTTFQNRCNLINLLLDSGADLNSKALAHLGTLSHLGTAIAEGTESNGLEQVIMRMIALGADVNAIDFFGCTPLVLASCSTTPADLPMKSRVLQALLDTCQCDVNYCDEDGETALICASERGFVAAVEILAKVEGCDLDIQNNDGKSALMLAIINGHQKCAEMLIKAGAVETWPEDDKSS